MGGYLTRLVTRNSAPQAMRPVLHSASPVMNADPGLAVSDLDDAPLADALPPLINESGAETPQVQKSPASANGAALSLNPQLAAILPLRPVRPWARQSEVAEPAPNKSPAGAETAGRSPSAPQGKPAERRLSPIVPLSSVSERIREIVDRNPDRGTDTSLRENARPLFAAPAETRSSAPSDSAPQRLEFVPRSAAASSAAGPASGDDAEETKIQEGPRITIGSIRVEVVPAAQPPVSAPARQPAVTAASVSVIGPLSGRVRANRRLSLRYR